MKKYYLYWYILYWGDPCSLVLRDNQKMFRRQRIYREGYCGWNFSSRFWGKGLASAFLFLPYFGRGQHFWGTRFFAEDTLFHVCAQTLKIRQTSVVDWMTDSRRWTLPGIGVVDVSINHAQVGKGSTTFTSSDGKRLLRNRSKEYNVVYSNKRGSIQSIRHLLLCRFHCVDRHV